MSARLLTGAVALRAGLALFGASAPAQQPPRFEVTVAPSVYPGPLTGRLIIAIATTEKPEPRLAISPHGPAVYGVDLQQLAPNTPAVVTESATAYPLRLAQLPPGDYYAQAIINVYQQLHRSDGHTIWAHMGDGRVEFFNTAPGNLYSDVQRVHIGSGGTVHLAVTHVIPPRKPLVDTKWVKHVTLQSPMLTRFWGHPVFIHANVLLPRGYDEHPNVHYPSVYALGHGNVPFGFDSDSSSDRVAIDAAAASQAGPNPDIVRRGARVNRNTGLESGYDFYRSWTSDGFPRVIAITLEQSTPYFPDSYSVNSANNGPYGDAIVQEMVPFLEQRFRIIRKPYARHVEGASTSGWQTLALELQHPDVFGNAWVLQPDPIAFKHYQQTDIYADSNAFSLAEGAFTALVRPFQRTVTGQVTTTTEELSHFEDVLGSHGRSGYQLEAWEAVYGPVGADGYPVPLWNKQTGTIDHTVANYMRDHGYDLLAYAQKNWATLGPRLQGQLHFFAGDMDNFYLDLAVYDFQDFLENTTNPHSDADFTYGRPMKGHSWHSYTWAEMVRKMAAASKARAPRGEDTSAWSY